MMVKKKEKVLYPELSYRIVGCLFEVYNQLGAGHRESYYQKALAEEFRANGLVFEEQRKINLEYKNKVVGKNYLDFLIEDKVVLELKIGRCFSKNSFRQTQAYLKKTGYKLGIIALFTSKELKFYRVLNDL